ncbi:hypothetical protein [Paraburkholderia strydomiana]|uniref:hypothetical protein n=1 Tax=Paraburkholderia strydomiana TaxID=1245417 RepID=UPI001BEAE5A7|nr:hypothetical protein [Paraburkholderia strydomiana]MBT2794574.1 hypothetical protein [Paraburkholderia strydomiana]
MTADDVVTSFERLRVERRADVSIDLCEVVAGGVCAEAKVIRCRSPGTGCVTAGKYNLLMTAEQARQMIRALSAVVLAIDGNILQEVG